MSKSFIIIILMIWGNALYSQQLSNDSINRNLINHLDIIEKSTNSISNKIDSCCKSKTPINKARPTSISKVTLVDINNKIDLTIKKIDSSIIDINSKIDYCCAEQVTLIEPKPSKDINNCYCIYTIAGILLGILSIILITIYYLLGKEKFIILSITNFEKTLPHLPFIIVVWTIGFCLFMNVYCKINFNNLSSINYNHQLLLLFSISLILLPFLKTIKIGKYFELERNIKETKEEVKDFKTEIRQNFQTLASTLTATISSINKQAQTVNHTTNLGSFGTPLPDTKLPKLESKIERILKAKLKEHGISISTKNPSDFYVPDNSVLMFKVRYNIEIQLRRIWEQRFIRDDETERLRFKPILRIIQDLIDYEYIDKNLYSIIKEILSICNYAIHGEKISDNQIQFVKNSSNQVIEYLDQIN